MDIFQGMVFSPIPSQPDDLLTKHETPAPDDAEPTESVPRASLVSTIAESFKQMLFPSCDVSCPNFLHSVEFLCRSPYCVLSKEKKLHFSTLIVIDMVK